MVRLSDDVEGTMPDLTFFLVSGQWNKKFQPVAKITQLSRYLAVVYFEDDEGSLQSLADTLVKEGLAEEKDY